VRLPASSPDTRSSGNIQEEVYALRMVSHLEGGRAEDAPLLCRPALREMGTLPRQPSVDRWSTMPRALLAAGMTGCLARGREVDGIMGTATGRPLLPRMSKRCIWSSGFGARRVCVSHCGGQTGVAVLRRVHGRRWIPWSHSLIFGAYLPSSPY